METIEVWVKGTRGRYVLDRELPDGSIVLRPAKRRFWPKRRAGEQPGEAETLDGALAEISSMLEPPQPT